MLFVLRTISQALNVVFLFCFCSNIFHQLPHGVWISGVPHAVILEFNLPGLVFFKFSMVESTGSLLKKPSFLGI